MVRLTKTLGIACLVGLLLVAWVGSACAWSTHAYKRGSIYHVNPYPGGGGTLKGYNKHTGSSWNTPYDFDENSDSPGNYWNYNRSTRGYWNPKGTMRPYRGHRR